MTYDKSQALAAVRRSARAAEKRLNATEAEIRFASDIAAGIYTADMIPAVMDADKITELADCYIAEIALDAGEGQPQTELGSEQEDISSAPSNSSIHISYTMPEDDLLDMVDHMRTSSAPVPETPPAPDTSGSSRSPKKSISLYFFLQRLRPWTPAIILVILVVALCVSSVYPSSSDTTKGASSSGTSDVPAKAGSPSHAVDHITMYWSSINSDLIHKSSCQYAKNILNKNRIYYQTVADAVADGLSKCSTCLNDASQTASNTAPDMEKESGEKSFTENYLELRKKPMKDVLGTDTPQDVNKSTSLVPVTPPENGEILKDTRKEKLAPLTIKTSGSQNYFISLKCVNSPDSWSVTELGRINNNRLFDMTVYVKGGETAEVLVPLAEYEIYYATGNTWYGSIAKFGEETRCFQCEDTFLFEEQWDDEGLYYGGWTLTLYAVPGGNLDTEEISLSKFPS